MILIISIYFMKIKYLVLHILLICCLKGYFRKLCDININYSGF